MSQRHKRFSREGFQPLAHRASNDNMPATDGNPNDVTIDIPLTKVTTSKSTGARKPNATSPNAVQPPDDFPDLDQSMSEKHSHFHRRGEGGRRRKLEQQGKENKDTQDGTLNAMGKLYDKIYHFSVITRYMLYVAPVASAIAIPIIVGATAAPNARIGGVRIVWFFTWIEVLWCSLWVSKLAAQFIPVFFQYVVGVISSGTRKYALILTALEIPLSLVGWAVTSLTTFVPLMTLNPDQRSRGDTSLKEWQSIIKNILFACVFSTLVLLAEKLLIQLIAISYHRKQFDDKIKSSKRNIFLVTLLYDASRTLFPAYCPEFAEEDYIISDVLDLGGGQDDKGHKRSGSATPMRLIQNVARVGDKVTAAFGNVAQEITGKQVFNPTAAHSIVISAVEKKRSAEALARRLWLSFVLEGQDALHLEDIIDVLGHEREAEAEEAFACLDADGNGDISLDEMILRIGEFGRERSALAHSMRDVDQAIHVLDNLLMTVVFIMVIFIFVAWLNSNFTTTLATAGTALLSLSFVFAATAQEVLGSCIFIFVKHPFDVGDRVDIGSDQYVVERISLLYTMFRKLKDHKRTQVPNIVLNSLWIDNISRSKAMREQIQLYISFDTTFEDVELLRKEMQNFVLDKDNARDFQPDIDIEVTGIAEMNKLELKVEIRHKSNWANEAVRAARRSKFMCALVLALKKIPIYGPGGGGAAAGDKANPTYSVAISDSDARANKAIFEKEKDGKRLIPLSSAADKDESSGNSSSADFFGHSSNEAEEMRSAQVLNHRNVAVDPARDGIDDPSQEIDAVSEQKRTENIEAVKNILRRESTTGRRKAARHSALSGMASNGGINRVSTIAEPTASGVNLAVRAMPPRVSYYEDDGFSQTASAAPQVQVQVPAPLQYPAPLQTQPQTPPSRMRSESVVVSPTIPESEVATYPGGNAGYVPGNAFSQQQQQRSPPRRPVPGIGDMKGYLQQQGGQR